eukprot:388268-Prymnesium_polylepis.5
MGTATHSLHRSVGLAGRDLERFARSHAQAWSLMHCGPAGLKGRRSFPVESTSRGLLWNYNPNMSWAAARGEMRTRIVRYEDLTDPRGREAALADAVEFAGFGRPGAATLSCAFGFRDIRSIHRSHGRQGLSAETAYRLLSPEAERAVWEDLRGCAAEYGYTHQLQNVSKTSSRQPGARASSDGPGTLEAAHSTRSPQPHPTATAQMPPPPLRARGAGLALAGTGPWHPATLPNPRRAPMPLPLAAFSSSHNVAAQARLAAALPD